MAGLQLDVVVFKVFSNLSNSMTVILSPSSCLRIAVTLSCFFLPVVAFTWDDQQHFRLIMAPVCFAFCCKS